MVVLGGRAAVLTWRKRTHRSCCTLDIRRRGPEWRLPEDVGVLFISGVLLGVCTRVPKANRGGVARAFLTLPVALLAAARSAVLLAWPGVSMVGPPLLAQLTGETACREPTVHNTPRRFSL